MLHFILRRIAYSILILFGVLILTFVLFRMAAGDPTATLLGKNPTPQEVESLRESLGADKPLFCGHWKLSEVFTHTQFQGNRTGFRAVTYAGENGAGEDGYHLAPGAQILYQSNFETEGKVALQVQGNGEYQVTTSSGETFDLNKDQFYVLSLCPEWIRLTGKGSGALISDVQFFRPTKHFFDSQALASIKEVIRVQSSFPYIRLFDFGKTLQTREPIRGKLWHCMWPSLFLMLPIFFGELFFGIVLAMLSCIWHGRLGDRLIMLLSVAGMSISYLALIIFGQWIFAYRLNWFPVWGWGDIRYIALPVLIGIISGTGSGARFYRTVFLNEMGREYLRTARAKGLAPGKVWFKHLLKNALVPIITRASTVLPFLFTGSLLLESFFGIPGLGYEGINALNDSDLQMLKALVILGAFLFVVINLLTDIAYICVDPRMRPSQTSSR